MENVEVMVVLIISTAVEVGEADSAASRLCKGEPRQQQLRRGKALIEKRGTKWRECPQSI